MNKETKNILKGFVLGLILVVGFLVEKSVFGQTKDLSVGAVKISYVEKYQATTTTNQFEILMGRLDYLQDLINRKCVP